jgi:hypothetical protein
MPTTGNTLWAISRLKTLLGYARGLAALVGMMARTTAYVKTLTDERYRLCHVPGFQANRYTREVIAITRVSA